MRHGRAVLGSVKPDGQACSSSLMPCHEQLAAEIRERLITVLSNNGGHLGPNLGMVELTIALHYVFHNRAGHSRDDPSGIIAAKVRVREGDLAKTPEPRLSAILAASWTSIRFYCALMKFRTC